MRKYAMENHPGADCENMRAAKIIHILGYYGIPVWPGFPDSGLSLSGLAHVWRQKNTSYSKVLYCLPF